MTTNEKEKNMKVNGWEIVLIFVLIYRFDDV